MTQQRILLVDDDELLCEVLADFIELAGHAVVRAGNGREALETLDRGERFDLIVLDLVMPEIDGIRFMRILRDRGKECPPVLVLSASASTEVVGAIDFACVVGVVRKPVRPPELLDHIARALASSSGC